MITLNDRETLNACAWPFEWLSSEFGRYDCSTNRFRLRETCFSRTCNNLSNRPFAQDIDWKNLDKQVNRALPDMKKEWDKLAERVKKDPEWVRFQWLWMETGNAGSETISSILFIV